MSTVKTAICRLDTGDVARSVKPYEEEIPWKIEGEGKVEKFFDNRAHYYDKQMEGIYNGPRISAQQLTKFVREKENKILDIAAGTGLVGKALFDEGFTNITAIDRNEQMLKQAASKGVYTEIHMGSFEDNSLADNSFHACVCVGAFLTSGFLDPVRAVKEMIRLTAIDGIILIMVNGTELGECKSVMQSLVGAFSAATEGFVQFSDRNFCSQLLGSVRRCHVGVKEENDIDSYGRKMGPTLVFPYGKIMRRNVVFVSRPK